VRSSPHDFWDRLLANAQEGIVKKKILHEIEEINQRHQLQLERCEALTHLLQIHLSNEDIVELLQLREDIMTGLENATPEDKRRAFELLKVKVVVKNKKATISWRLPIRIGVIDLNRSPVIGRGC
jgi:hypothetical protein